MRDEVPDCRNEIILEEPVTGLNCTNTQSLCTKKLSLLYLKMETEMKIPTNRVQNIRSEFQLLFEFNHELYIEKLNAMLQSGSVQDTFSKEILDNLNPYPLNTSFQELQTQYSCKIYKRKL